jgi:hypothetical protein
VQLFWNNLQKVNNYTKTLLLELEEQLKFISLETDSPLASAELSIQVIQKTLQNLKTYTVKYKFKSTAEEIKFFKELKPAFHSKLIYHLFVYNIETRRPKGGFKVIKKYLQSELDKLKRYFDANLEFYKYYRTGSNYLDHRYFVRDKYDPRLSPEPFYFDTDPKFCASHDYRISTILANDLLQVYLEDELSELEKKEPKIKSEAIQKSESTWTGSKVSLIELLYSLHADDSINHGKAELKEIAATLEKAFNIDLGQYHRTFLELRMRKGSRTKYIDSLRDSLIKRMDNADEDINQ